MLKNANEYWEGDQRRRISCQANWYSISFYFLKTVFKKSLNTLYDSLVEGLEKLNSFHFKGQIMILSPRKYSSRCTRYLLVLKKGWIYSNFVKSCSSAFNMETIGHFSSSYFFFTTSWPKNILGRNRSVNPNRPGLSEIYQSWGAAPCAITIYLSSWAIFSITIMFPWKDHLTLFHIFLTIAHKKDGDY